MWECVETKENHCIGHKWYGECIAIECISALVIEATKDATRSKYSCVRSDPKRAQAIRTSEQSLKQGYDSIIKRRRLLASALVIRENQ